ncbi:MAG TPA: TrkA family potassium uptake protein [Erysipelothrix sp.]|nr:TrkA family potassium uptake protein [Erysipelothrix sp.]
MKKTVAILGLGLFGASVAKSLAKQDVDVIAIDSNMERVEEVMEWVEHAVKGDFTKVDHLIEAGVDGADIAIIASGERLESSIMAILNLKKIGVQEVVVKTKNTDYLEVLKKVGADRVLLPEVEMGKRVANEIAKHSIIDTLAIDENYNIAEVHPLKEWIGKTLQDADIRNRYGFNVLAIKIEGSNNMETRILPDRVILEGDLFVVLSDNEDLEKFDLL